MDLWSDSPQELYNFILFKIISTKSFTKFTIMQLTNT